MSIKPELLLPVGNFEMAEAAIHNGADAIYVGFPNFNARGRAEDLSFEKLKELIEICHLFGVKVNLALNILIFQNEFPQLISKLSEILKLQPDALIIQDLGLVTLIRKMAPQQVIHASTQMTVSNFEAIYLLKDLDIKRFVLARENSISEIQMIRKNVSEELEVFIHGALCVAYSGQCFTSESIGGRSANRGQCAQSCRFGYELIVDGKPLGNKRKYVVSPQDLCGLNEIKPLIEIGINSFKVEGRLKSIEYVATTAKEYHKEIHRVLNNSELSQKEKLQSQRKMAIVYSRGFYSGWLHGVNHQELVNGCFSAHRGLYLGKITDVDERSRSMILSLEQSYHLKPGDGLLWSQEFAGKEGESGGQIFHAMKRKNDVWKLEFSNSVKISRTLIGSMVYLNHDSDLEKEVRQSVQDRNFRKKIPVDIQVSAKKDDFLQISISDGIHIVSKRSPEKVQTALKNPMTEQMLREEFSALGGTVFKLKSFTAEIEEQCFLPQGQIKKIRQELTGELEQIRKGIDQICEASVLPKDEVTSWFDKSKMHREDNTIKTPGLRVLLRNREQVSDFVSALGREIDAKAISSVILDFEFGRDYEASLSLLKTKNVFTVIATTRVLKPNEYKNLKVVEQLNPDGILIRNLGALFYFKNQSQYAGKLFGDFSLNVANHLAAKYLFGKGLKTLSVSYDLNQEQVNDLLMASDAQNLEITVHQYMPSFHMEHCVFAAFLSQGKTFIDCGKPCEKHELELKDQFGNCHRIKPDQECRNTMYNAVPYSAVRMIQGWIGLGIGYIRYEALKETDSELINKVSTYQKFLKGELSTDEVLDSLKSVEKYGLSEGALARANEYISKKKLNK